MNKNKLLIQNSSARTKTLTPNHTNAALIVKCIVKAVIILRIFSKYYTKMLF